VKYFDLLSGVDLIDQDNETANAIHNMIKSIHDTHKLEIKIRTSYCADNGNVIYGKQYSVFKLLQEVN
jgi:hypothetical protein